jgi:glycerate-2-kinase
MTLSSLTSHFAGEVREAARVLAVAKDAPSSGVPCPRLACLLTGGETTVSVQGVGKEMEKNPTPP